MTVSFQYINPPEAWAKKHIEACVYHFYQSDYAESARRGSSEWQSKVYAFMLARTQDPELTNYLTNFVCQSLVINDT